MATASPSSASPATPWVGDVGRSAVAGVMPLDLRERADALRAGRTPFVVATVVRAERPTSAKAGDRALILPDGTLEGFVGGTCAESTIRHYGLRLLSGGGPDGEVGGPPLGEPRSTLLRIEPEPPPGHAGDDSGQAGGAVTVNGRQDPDGVVTVVNPCLSGGTLEIFLESVVPPPRVHVLGAAPIAQAMVRLGTALGYDVVATTDPARPLAPDTAAVVVASHGRDEEAMLAAALRAAVPYVGLVASRRRSAAVLAALDMTDEERARIRTPAGLDIGARTAPEIALSILAQVVATRATTVRTSSAARAATGGNVPAVQPAAAAADQSAAHDETPIEMHAPHSHGAAAGQETVVDPVCGMTVEMKPGSLRYEHDGTTYYFCGAGCRQAFAADAQKYL
jgi:xanthine dehydrogenase accessory factor